MKLKNIFCFAAVGLGVVSCANEAPFSGGQEGEGKFLSHSISVQVKTSEPLVRATSTTLDVNDFSVAFLDAESTSEVAVKTYKYSELPEVVTLPVGSYKVKAVYGGDFDKPAQTAAFNSPYYKGESEVFEIEKNKIVDNLDPVVCKLANVRVSVDFDAKLKNKMSEDSRVIVTVGENETLEFSPSTEESGYFAYAEGSNTLAASFFGIVDGDDTKETKSYSNVAPGVHYRINFRLHEIDPNEPGDINPGDEGEEIKVDAVVNLEDLSGDGGVDIPIGEEIYLDDDRYPTEGPDEPYEPDDPVTGTGPEVTCEGAQFDIPNQVSEMSGCSIIVNSESGLEVFSVTIDSDKLTPEELEGVGLTYELDLITPGQFLEPLQNFGFLESGQKTLQGEKEVVLDLSPFLELLQMLGDGTHKFILTIGDDSGNTVKKLILITKEEE